MWKYLVLKNLLVIIMCYSLITYSKNKFSLVKCHHASSDRHVHWNLRWHAADQDHLLPGIGMESRVKDIFGSPQLILSQTWRDYTLPEGWQRSKLNLVTAMSYIQLMANCDQLWGRNLAFTCSQWWFYVRVLVVRWWGGCSWGLWQWRNV